MSKSFFRESGGRDAALTLVVLGLFAGVFGLPFQLRSEAAKGLFEGTGSHDEGLPNYDIRTDKSAFEQMAAFRSTANKTAIDVADERQSFYRGEEELRLRVPTLKVEYNADLRIPEVIGPDVLQGKAFLTDASARKRSDILKAFLTQNSELIGATEQQIADLKVVADYTNPDGNLSFVELNQEINGIPVFRGEVKAGFTKRGEIVRVINNFAPGLDETALSTDFGDTVRAVQAAAGHIRYELNLPPPKIPPSRDSDKKVVFGTGDSATTAEKIYFPTEPGVAVPAWRVLIWQPVNAYYVIVDSASGTMLWRKNITEDQTQSATYSVYANPNAMINVAHSPFPISPGPTSPNQTQGAAIVRTLVTRVGNEPPYTFNQLGWIADGDNDTNGNNVEAGLDRDTTNGVDATNGRAIGNARTFSFPLNPLDPNTNSGDSPTPAGEPVTPLPEDLTPGVCDEILQPHAIIDAQRASLTQLFYIANWYHDEAYSLGFTEAARNFQHVNFTGQGVAGDRVSAEGQDCVGTNNANFATPADGTRGRMQMFIWTGPNPDLDGNLDASVVIHEHTHGLSNRLHGNGSGLVNDMSRGMGEGWSDFYGLSLLSQASDPPGGIYTTAAYDTYRKDGSFFDNSYYGIRRFPTVIKSSVGGPGSLPHNPLTFADIDATQINLSDGAFAPRLNSGNSDQVHNAGEIWSSALWEIRARYVARLGWAIGNRRILQFVTDGMKLAPLSPTFISERDAIISAALASGTAADVADMWAGFAIRGLGASASIQNVGGTSTGGTGTARVTEAFNLPNLSQSPGLTISDPLGNNNGFADPGEAIRLSIPLSNITGNNATSVTLQVIGGGSANYGDLTNGAVASRDVTYVVPNDAACGSIVTLTINVNSSLGPTSFVRTFAVGAPNTTLTENFDAVTPPGIPAGWSVTASYAPMTFVSTATGPDTVPNSMFAADLPDCTTGCPTTNGGSTELTSPPLFISAAAATVTFRHKYLTETGWDGGVLEISIAGGAYQDILTAGGSFLQNGYTGLLGVSTPNPLGGRSGWSGDSAGYITSVARLPAAAAGQNNVRLRWHFGTDSNSAPAGGGWNIDSIQVAGSYSCFVPTPSSLADFDGDGKTDISIYRPAVGEWWYQKSSDLQALGFQFGASTDRIVPGDHTGDGKTDIAIWRPSNGFWYILRSEDFSFYGFPFGMAGDVPVPGDYDGDGKTDAAIFRPSAVLWVINKSSGGVTFQPFGFADDKPVVADYDGDGKSDIAIYRPSVGEWYYQRSSDGFVAGFQFGNSTDKPVQGDYTGDGKADVAIWRPSTGFWYILRSEDFSFYGIPWGLSTDVPAPGDFDGDGKFDASIFRPSNSLWCLNRSTAGVYFQQFGIATDTPVPSAFIP